MLRFSLARSHAKLKNLIHETQLQAPSCPPARAAQAPFRRRLSPPSTALFGVWYGVNDFKRRLCDQPELRAQYEEFLAWRPAPRVLLDPELGRLAIGLNLAPLLRVWAVARDWIRQGTGAGYVTRSALREALAQLQLSDRHLRHLLTDGDGLFWRLHEDRIYLCGVIQLAERLTARALLEHPDLVLTNRPGVLSVAVSIGGSLADWEAQLYAAWCYHRDNPTIARETLTNLFGRSADTLRRWETRAPIQVRPNYAQTAQPFEEICLHLPLHSRQYAARTRDGQVVRHRWQISNSYVTPLGTFKTHPHRGQSSRVRKAVNHLVETYQVQPAALWRGGALRERLYFDSARQSARSVHWRNQRRRRGKRNQSDYGEQADRRPKQRYLWRGENRHGHGIFELSFAGEYATYANERLYPRAEKAFLAPPKASLQP